MPSFVPLKPSFVPNPLNSRFLWIKLRSTNCSKNHRRSLLFSLVNLIGTITAALSEAVSSWLLFGDEHIKKIQHMSVQLQKGGSLRCTLLFT